MTFVPRIKLPVDAPKRGDTLASIAESFVGCSLTNRTAELAELIAGGDDDPWQAVRVKTNCATFARGVLEAAGVYHKTLDGPYKIGMAVADVLSIGRRMNAVLKFTGQSVYRGDILYYVTPGHNNDHIECCLLEDASDSLGWVKRHCGGGRANNAITEKNDDIRWSSGRPLKFVLSAMLLMEPQ